jgi:hypothetical protein
VVMTTKGRKQGPPEAEREVIHLDGLAAILLFPTLDSYRVTGVLSRMQTESSPVTGHRHIDRSSPEDDVLTPKTMAHRNATQDSFERM